MNAMKSVIDDNSTDKRRCCWNNWQEYDQVKVLRRPRGVG